MIEAEYSHYYRGVGVSRRRMQVEAFITGFDRDPAIPEHILAIPYVVDRIPQNALPFHYENVEEAISPQDPNLSSLFPVLKDVIEPLSSLAGFIESYHVYRTLFW